MQSCCCSSVGRVCASIVLRKHNATATFRCEQHAHGVDAMALVCAIPMFLTTKDMPQVTIAMGAHNFTTATVRVSLLVHAAFHIGPEAWPSATTIVLHLARVQGRLLASCIARSTEVDTLLEVIVKAQRNLQFA